MVINTNIGSIRGSRLLAESARDLNRSLSRLSSGSRIVSPEDDAAGLAQSVNLSSEKLRNSAAAIGLENAVSFAQTQDGYLQKVQKALDRMSELSVLALDATKTDNDRANLDSEFQALATNINDTFSKKFNERRLFLPEPISDDSNNVTAHRAKVFDLGKTPGTLELTYNFFTTLDRLTIYYPPRSSGGGPALYDSGMVNGIHTITLELDGSSSEIEIVANEGGAGGTGWEYSGNFTSVNKYVTEGTGTFWSESLMEGLSVSGSLANESSARTALGTVKESIETIASRRADVGARLARLQAHLDELSFMNESLGTAVSRISDTDVAQESTRFARHSILVQTGTAMLAQSNAQHQSVLRLLGS